jgi:hypothetical protein
MAKAKVKTIRGKNPDGWSRRFDDPIALPDGGELTTLKQVVAYLAKTVPKAEQSRLEVLAAAEIMTYAAEREIAWMFLARMATLRAIHRNKMRVFNPDRNDTHWGKRKLKRDL